MQEIVTVLADVSVLIFVVSSMLAVTMTIDMMAHEGR